MPHNRCGASSVSRFGQDANRIILRTRIFYLRPRYAASLRIQWAAPTKNDWTSRQSRALVILVPMQTSVSYGVFEGYGFGDAEP